MDFGKGEKNSSGRRPKTFFMDGPPLTLKNGSKIAVIGAGPAGTFFADKAEQLARQRGIDISVNIFDGKDFTQRGPMGCNLCAGVIAESLVNRLYYRGIVLPPERVQNTIEGYYLRGRAGGYLLKNPLNRRRITTVFRGNGPRKATEEGNVSFDDYLLEHVRRKGIKVVGQMVKNVSLPTDPEKQVRITTEKDGKKSSFYADLVVGAFGVSGSLTRKIQDLGFGYIPPRTIRAWNVEIRLRRDFIQKNFGNNIFTYNLSTLKGTCVLSIIPKKDFITVNMVGSKDIRREDLADFLDLLVLQKKLPRYWKWSYNFCSCAPRVPVTQAKKPYTNRMVIIGDASCCRYYKNGIESAFITAQLAAETAFKRGISESDFKKGYYRNLKKTIIKDNTFGRILFRINDVVSSSTFLSQVMFRVAGEPEKHRKTNRMVEVLWNTYTGNIPYKPIFLMFIHPALQWKLIVVTVKLFLEKVYTRFASLWRARNGLVP